MRGHAASFATPAPSSPPRSSGIPSPCKGRLDRGGHCCAGPRNKNKAGEEGGLRKLSVEKGGGEKHAGFGCPHLCSAFEAAPLRSDQDIFKVQFEVCVYPRHLAGVSGAGAVLVAEAAAVAALLCWLHRPACRAELSRAEPRRPKPAGPAQSVFIGRGHWAPSLNYARAVFSRAAGRALPRPPPQPPCLSAGQCAVGGRRGRVARPQPPRAGRGGGTAAALRAKQGQRKWRLHVTERAPPPLVPGAGARPCRAVAAGLNGHLDLPPSIFHRPEQGFAAFLNAARAIAARPKMLSLQPYKKDASRCSWVVVGIPLSRSALLCFQTRPRPCPASGNTEAELGSPSGCRAQQRARAWFWR